jgi:hypothetical protein
MRGFYNVAAECQGESGLSDLAMLGEAVVIQNECEGC